MFITFEGIEGCGKSTQAARVAAHLRARGIEVVATREPGGTEVTAQIRSLLADPRSNLDPSAELLLFMADRAQHVASVIAPALAAGKTVICDRYADSTMAYQGYGRGHDLAWLDQLNAFASRGVVPALTLWIDCDVRTGLGRAKTRSGGPGDRFEAEPLRFHERVRSGFVALHAAHPQRIARIDGNVAEDDVTTACIAAVEAQLEAAGATGAARTSSPDDAAQASESAPGSSTPRGAATDSTGSNR
ncbi:MAG: dTMP kinase [Deltaproteobacteria bacterium]|nr:dTMP kinase [Deltaproteobacteria bacterium]